MGNSSSAPTSSANARDSEYFRQYVDDSEVVNPTALASSYIDVYSAYLEGLLQQLSSQEYKFTTSLSRRNAIGSGSSSVSEALTIKGRLKAQAINRVLNELCKYGRLHDDLKIQFHLPLPVDTNEEIAHLHSILRRCNLDVTSKVVCKGEESAFVNGWGVIGTAIVDVNLTLDDLEPDSIQFMGLFASLTAFFRNRHVGQQDTTHVDATSTTESSPSSIEECCICLEPLLVSQQGTGGSQQIYFMQCGHCLHRSCYQQLIERNAQSVCPMCRHRIEPRLPSSDRSVEATSMEWLFART